MKDDTSSLSMEVLHRELSISQHASEEKFTFLDAADLTQEAPAYMPIPNKLHLQLQIARSKLRRQRVTDWVFELTSLISIILLVGLFSLAVSEEEVLTNAHRKFIAVYSIPFILIIGPAGTV